MFQFNQVTVNMDKISILPSAPISRSIAQAPHDSAVLASDQWKTRLAIGATIVTLVSIVTVATTLGLVLSKTNSSTTVSGRVISE